VYGKALLRCKVFRRKNKLILADSAIKTASVDNEILPARILNNFSGHSLNFNVLTAKDMYGSSLRFSTDSFDFTAHYEKYLYDFNRVLYCLDRIKRKEHDSISKNYLLLLKPIKGGFEGFCCGMVGFVPSSSLVLTGAFNHFHSILKNYSSTAIRKSLIDDRNFLLRIFISNIKLSLCPQFIEKDFDSEDEEDSAYEEDEEDEEDIPVIDDLQFVFLSSTDSRRGSSKLKKLTINKTSNSTDKVKKDKKPYSLK
jgi:hypothetical protein